MTSTVLVTGAAGFIGSHVVDALLARGDRVVGLDNLNDYYDPARKRHNVQESRAAAPAPERYEFVEGDIRDRPGLARLFEEHRIEAVAHLAAMAGVRASVDDPYLYYDVNLTGTMALLEQARHSGLKNFVLASTSSVYANTETIPFIETDSCDRPLAPYPASKRSAELLGHAYHHLHGLSFTAVRLFTVYGPRGRPDMMAYKLLDNMFAGREVPLYNGGQMHRDWTYVTDTAAGIVAALDHPLGFEVINLGCAEPVLLADFVTKMEDQAGRKTSLRDEPMQDADVNRTYANIDKAQRLLGYAPTVHVDEGIAGFWEWYRTAVLDQSAG
ncbi:MAG: GDP-mannose 4,6-dehydratase [Deltaproteobacteria bacterium]|nr:GDP-mannose 4,6-dehydratase [Deltaproteobacteria bacterium]